MPTVLLMVFCLLFGIPATILLTPDQELTIAGQHLSVGAPGAQCRLSGPAQLVQIGNTKLDIAPFHLYDQLQQRLTLGPVEAKRVTAAAPEPATDPRYGRPRCPRSATAFCAGTRRPRSVC